MLARIYIVSNANQRNLLLTLAEKACLNTSVTVRELMKELSKDEISMIKEGELGADYLTSLVDEIASTKAPNTIEPVADAGIIPEEIIIDDI